MRYSCTALVLATALISGVAAGPVKHAHAHFHKKKDADLEKKTFEWADIVYDVNWSTVSYTYSSGQTWGDPTAVAKNDALASTGAAAAPVKTTTTTTVAPTNAAPVKPTLAALVDPTTTAPIDPTTTAPVDPTTAAHVDPTTAASVSPTPSVSVPATSDILASSDLTKIIDMGIAGQGINAVSEDGGVWIGDGGSYTNEFINSSGEDLILVIWGAAGSWVNVQKPLITVSLPNGGSSTISFADGVSGAWSAVYSDTQLVNGQISNPWGEYTFTAQGVVDVSFEPNMDGHPMEIVGPLCTSNKEKCSFQCTGGATTCEYGYELLNCTPGSQPGAQYGLFDGSPSGGCGWLGATTVALQTTFL